MASLSISLQGDKKYRDALGIVAKRHNTDIGVLVREALDERFGNEITEALSFFDPIVDLNQRKQVKITDSAEVNNA